MLYISFGIAMNFFTVTFPYIVSVRMLHFISICLIDVIFLFQFCFSHSLKSVPMYIPRHLIGHVTN